MQHLVIEADHIAGFSALQLVSQIALFAFLRVIVQRAPALKQVEFFDLLEARISMAHFAVVAQPWLLAAAFVQAPACEQPRIIAFAQHLVASGYIEWAPQLINLRDCRGPVDHVEFLIEAVEEDTFNLNPDMKFSLMMDVLYSVRGREMSKTEGELLVRKSSGQWVGALEFIAPLEFVFKNIPDAAKQPLG
ncbi:hypothetical protein T492DRAFT_844993 [Pavlovales sp. CCMP2436]|nr:hypothetical protein T492DRAFT_844993 [Pavlovales sp. CCMP2436]